MQMNGSGIICNGYMYYNYSTQGFGTYNVSSTDSNNPTVVSVTPYVGNAGGVTLHNTVSFSPWGATFSYYKVIFNGSYLSFGSSSPESISNDGSFAFQGDLSDRYISTGSRVRYA